MDRDKWIKFVKAREHFRHETQNLSLSLVQLKNLQQKLIDSRSNGGNSSYTVETPVVYNTALDNVTVDDEIKMILVADNPGRREQAAQNRRYLAGPSGKIAHNFFRDNPALGIDFAKNVIILNKTPIHTPRTNELRRLVSMEAQSANASHTGTEPELPVAGAIEESQRFMADILLEFQLALCAQVWIVGYSEMKKGGIFETFTERLKNLYAQRDDLYKLTFFYRHFSMNQFTIDLKKQSLPGETAEKALLRIGSAYRKRILGK
ncbi:MAG: hypothetical protein LBI12_07645 [Treponema sp.]|nr:hypothetical protein [Treponema sp.]